MGPTNLVDNKWIVVMNVRLNLFFDFEFKL